MKMEAPGFGISRREGERRLQRPCLWFRSLAYDRAEQSFPFVRLKLVQTLRHELADQLGQSGVPRSQDLVQQPLRQLLVAFGASSQFLETIRNSIPDPFRCCGHCLDPLRIIGLPAEKFQVAKQRERPRVSRRAIACEGRAEFYLSPRGERWVRIRGLTPSPVTRSVADPHRSDATPEDFSYAPS